MTIAKWTETKNKITARLDEAEAAWKTAKEELAILKSEPETIHPPGIEGDYASLTALFDYLKRRNTIIARFGAPLMGNDAFETLLRRS